MARLTRRLQGVGHEATRSSRPGPRRRKIFSLTPGRPGKPRAQIKYTPGMTFESKVSPRARTRRRKIFSLTPSRPGPSKKELTYEEILRLSGK